MKVTKIKEPTAPEMTEILGHNISELLPKPQISGKFITISLMSDLIPVKLIELIESHMPIPGFTEDIFAGLREKANQISGAAAQGGALIKSSSIETSIQKSISETRFVPNRLDDCPIIRA